LKKNHKKNYKEELRKKAELIIHEVSEETRIFLNNNKDLNYDDEKKILIPENCFDFINSRVEHWSKMAFDAMFNFERNKNYFISKDEYFGFDTIKPIDYINTGVILKNSVWSGLHQFLQIKEGLTFMEENINSSYM
jgi:preprotein translocase subunit SecA